MESTRRPGSTSSFWGLPTNWARKQAMPVGSKTVFSPGDRAAPDVMTPRQSRQPQPAASMSTSHKFAPGPVSRLAGTPYRSSTVNTGTLVNPLTPRPIFEQSTVHDAEPTVGGSGKYTFASPSGQYTSNKRARALKPALATTPTTPARPLKLPRSQTPGGGMTKSVTRNLFPMTIASPPPELDGASLSKHIPSDARRSGSVYADEILNHLVPAGLDEEQSRQFLCILDLRRLKHAANEIFAKKDWRINVLNFAKEYEKSRSLIMVHYGLYNFKTTPIPSELLAKWQDENSIISRANVDRGSPSKAAQSTRPVDTHVSAKRRAEDDLTRDSVEAGEQIWKHKRRHTERELMEVDATRETSDAHPSARTPAEAGTQRTATTFEGSKQPWPKNETHVAPAARTTPSSTLSLFEEVANQSHVLKPKPKLSSDATQHVRRGADTLSNKQMEGTKQTEAAVDVSENPIAAIAKPFVLGNNTAPILDHVGVGNASSVFGARKHDSNLTSQAVIVPSQDSIPKPTFHTAFSNASSSITPNPFKHLFSGISAAGSDSGAGASSNGAEPTADDTENPIAISGGEKGPPVKRASEATLTTQRPAVTSPTTKSNSLDSSTIDESGGISGLAKTAEPVVGGALSTLCGPTVNTQQMANGSSKEGPVMNVWNASNKIKFGGSAVQAFGDAPKALDTSAPIFASGMAPSSSSVALVAPVSAPGKSSNLSVFGEQVSTNFTVPEVAPSPSPFGSHFSTQATGPEKASGPSLFGTGTTMPTPILGTAAETTGPLSGTLGPNESTFGLSSGLLHTNPASVKAMPFASSTLSGGTDSTGFKAIDATMSRQSAASDDQTPKTTNFFGSSSAASLPVKAGAVGLGAQTSFSFGAPKLAHESLGAKATSSPFSFSFGSTNASMPSFGAGSNSPAMGGAEATSKLDFNGVDKHSDLPSGSQAGFSFGSRTASPFASQPTTAFSSQPAAIFGSQSTNPFGSQTANPFGMQPAQAKEDTGTAAPASIFAFSSNVGSNNSAPNIFAGSLAAAPGAGLVGQNQALSGGAMPQATGLAPGVKNLENEGKAEQVADDDDTPQEQVSLTEGGPGEEEEAVVHEVRAKVVKFVSMSKDAAAEAGMSPKDVDTANPWKTQGVGALRLLKHKASGKARLLLRTEPRGHIALNRALLPNVKYTCEKGSKYVKLTTGSEDGKGIETWMLQVKTTKAAEDLASILEANK